MTAVDPGMVPPLSGSAASTPAPWPPAARPASPAPQLAPADPRAQLLWRIFDLMDRDGLAYCVTHADASFPQGIESDVDCVAPHELLPRRLAKLLKQNEQAIGARLVQWFEERANFIVLEARHGARDGESVLLQLHVSPDFEVKDRLIAGWSDVLRTRCSRLGGGGGSDSSSSSGVDGESFWIPAPHLEFACTLANRIDKGSLPEKQAQRLSALWSADPLGCNQQLERLFRAESVDILSTAAHQNEWDAVLSILPALRREMMWKLAIGQPLGVLLRFAGRQLRRLKRWTTPHAGLHVVFLGPDGVGKSTVIDAVRERVAPAFLRTAYQSFARSVLGQRPKPSPHAFPPRSWPASLLKACWWLACYTVGYFVSIYPTLVRGGLVLNHRYLLDAIVDPRRYRYSGPLGLLRAICAIAPKPDLVIVLDAPPDIIHARKRETTLEETTRQREAYLALARSLPNARIVDTSRSPQQTIDDVTRILLDHMAAKVARRLKLTPTALRGTTP